MRRVPPVKSMMTPFPYWVRKEAPVTEVKRMMREHQIRHLPVMEGDRLVGIVTDRDIKLVLGPDFAYPEESGTTVADVYLDDPYVVDLDEPLDRVLEAMAHQHIGSALVTREGRLAGLFTVTDACRCFAEHLRASAPGGGDEAA